jgi:hypothetical protein
MINLLKLPANEVLETGTSYNNAVHTEGSRGTLKL